MTRQHQSQHNTSETEKRWKTIHFILEIRKIVKYVPIEKKGERRKQTITYCSICPDNPLLHLRDCFEKFHAMKKLIQSCNFISEVFQ